MCHVHTSYVNTENEYEVSETTKRCFTTLQSRIEKYYTLGKTMYTGKIKTACCLVNTEVFRFFERKQTEQPFRGSFVLFV